MIDRFVFVRLKEEFVAERDDIAEYSAKVLAALPGVRSVAVGLPADDHATAAWDLSITVRFASIDEVESYRVHPDHRRYVDEYLAPRMQVIKAWNFAIMT